MEIEESLLAVCGLLLVMLTMREVAAWHAHHGNRAPRYVKHSSHHQPKGKP